jgi:acetyl-CoA carboxylase biotin carboxyl carrier protein
MKIQPRDIDALIEIFESSKWDEMHLEIDGFELYLSTDPKAKRPGQASSQGPSLAQSTPARNESGGAEVESTSKQAPPAPPQEVAVPGHWVAVKAPNLGTFYRAPKPGAPVFVEIGQAVEKETEICLIEVMKLFTTLKAGLKGTLRQVCVKDAVMVEHGDVLFYIEPA